MDNMDHIIIPKEEFEARKFIQLYLGDCKNMPIFRYASTDSPTRHMELLIRALKEFNLEITFIKQKPQDGGLRVVAPETKNYKFVGAGLCNFKNKEFELYGISSDYMLPPEREHMQRVQSTCKDITFKIS